MIKLTFVIRRRADVDEDEFHRYWREEHGPLVSRVSETLRIRRYVQSHRVATAVDDAVAQSRQIGIAPYDGIAELWWDSAEEIVAATSTEDGAAATLALLEDEARFIDLSASALWFNEESVIVDG